MTGLAAGEGEGGGDRGVDVAEEVAAVDLGVGV